MPVRPGRSRPQIAASASAAGIPAGEWPIFRKRLLSWFRNNQRDLPWRRTGDPYRIWLSEIMLQQTRVAAVIPYYERFLRQFPTMRHLARARLATVLAAWAGLGYYSRARNLHRAARQMVARHGGKVPRELNAALALPGVGRYTAAAILSIAYGEPLAALDGNVARVLARLGAQRGDLRAPDAWRRLDGAAAALLARQAPGDWNQAMMELGATVCTPASPRCGHCPVSRWCRARKLGLAERLPSARSKPRTVKISIAAAVLLDPRGRTLLVRQPASAPAPAQADKLFSRLWQFPAVETNGRPSADLSRHLATIIGDASTPAAAAFHAAMQPLRPARHSVTFQDIQLLPFLLLVQKLPAIRGARTPRLAALDLPAGSGRPATAGGPSLRGGPAISSATRKIAVAALRAI